MKKIFYDLTELFTASSKFRYYGIARVVAEIAFELDRKKCGVRFVVYSPGHRDFFEVFPKFLGESSAFAIDLGIPDNARPLRLRQKYYSTNILSKCATSLFSWILKRINFTKWKISGVAAIKADLAGSVVIATGRPRIIAEYIDALQRIEPNVKLIPMLHDMIALMDSVRKQSRRFSELFLMDNALLIKSASHIFSNSDFTKSEITAYVSKGILPPCPEITSIRLAHECRDGHEAPEKNIPERPYFLCVGCTVGRKNLQLVFDAYSNLVAGGKSPPLLVLAGTARSRIRKYLRQEKYCNITPYVMYCDNPNQTDLVRLYKSALGLILPSRIEGWGLPAGEALWFGTPVLCSDIPVLKEVCGESGMYFDPNSHEQLANLIWVLCSNQEFETSVRMRIKKERASLRSWRHVADEIKDVVERLPL